LSKHPRFGARSNTPNPTAYGLFVYQTCTFSVPFRRKTARNRGATASRFFAPSGRINPARMSPGISSPEIPPVLATVAKDREMATWRPPTQGPFPPQETAFYAESNKTFEPRNDLAPNGPILDVQHRGAEIDGDINSYHSRARNSEFWRETNPRHVSPIKRGESVRR
jgi:hypothetical protein